MSTTSEFQATGPDTYGANQAVFTYTNVEVTDAKTGAVVLKGGQASDLPGGVYLAVKQFTGAHHPQPGQLYNITGIPGLDVKNAQAMNSAPTSVFKK